jgi:sterol 3beta-glucosyltransferase
MVMEALSIAGQRGVLASGWGGLAAAPLAEHLHMLDAAPHNRLFPHAAAVVHHGGAGTTAAGLRAGGPTVICPFFGDQPFWGRRVADLGVGPAPIAVRCLKAARLAQAIQRAVNDGDMRRRVAELGTRLREEDGVGRAVEPITRGLVRRPPGRRATPDAGRPRRPY